MDSIDIPSLGDRIKEYENVTRTYLLRRTPAIIRLDGRAFHTFTKKFNKPFDKTFNYFMVSTMLRLMEEVQTAVLGYTQSDEISLLLKDYTKLETQAWFNGNIQKIASISASIASVEFNSFSEVKNRLEGKDFPVFDARVFNVPKEDVTNYFIWRQQDAMRNSVQSLGQSHFSHNQLMGKSNVEVVKMLADRNIIWSDIPTEFKRGVTSYYEETGLVANYDMPILTEDRFHVETYV